MHRQPRPVPIQFLRKLILWIRRRQQRALLGSTVAAIGALSSADQQSPEAWSDGTPYSASTLFVKRASLGIR